MSASIHDAMPAGLRSLRACTAEAALRRTDHYFYTGMSLAIAICVLAGFAETFYLRSYFHKPELHPVAAAHGVINTLWILIFVIQNVLVANGRVGLHRRLGRAASALSLLIVPAGIATGVDAARQVTSTMRRISTHLFSFSRFATAIYLRRNAQAHKRLAMLAAIALFSEPAIGRIPGLTFPIIALLVLSFIFAGPTWDLVTRRRIHPAYLWAVPAMLILSPLTPVMIFISKTAVWHRFSDWLIR